MANALDDSGRYDQARAQYAIVAKQKRSRPEAHNGIGLYHLRRDQLKAAEAAFRMAITVAPKFIPAYNNLAVTLERANQRPRAIALLQRALTISPGDSAIPDVRKNLRRMQPPARGSRARRLRVHLVANIHRPDALDAALKAAGWLRSRGIDVGSDAETARRVDLPEVPEEDFGKADLVAALGGDGTLIRAAHLCAESGTPVLGIYYGRFGFVTQCREVELGACLAAFFDGNTRTESRMMLQGELLRAGSVVATLHSLNEMVLQRAVTARMMTFRVTVDGHYLTSYPADG